MGEQHYKRVCEKFLFIHEFLREYFIMKVVENSPQNARNCTIFKNFLGGACPQTPLATAHSFAARNMPLFLSWAPPLEKSCIRPCLMSIGVLRGGAKGVLPSPPKSRKGVANSRSQTNKVQ